MLKINLVLKRSDTSNTIGPYRASEFKRKSKKKELFFAGSSQLGILPEQVGSGGFSPGVSDRPSSPERLLCLRAAFLPLLSHCAR